ncbi:MAG: guanine deaminase [Oscillatoriales cyanobacterium SM2_3_0]|nr:guanine deaminase [Oscillatoriales cyanobacterium SM2_3_0]
MIFTVFEVLFLDFIGDPFDDFEANCTRFFADGLLVVESGKIKDFGEYRILKKQYPELEITAYPNQLMIPGLIDLHVHYPQTEMVAAYGEQLLEWLNKYTFPTEARFKHQAHAQIMADFFLDELLRHGTTTALVLTTVFPESVDAFFEAADRRHLRMIAGKVMMDRNAPKELLDTASTSYEQSHQLIQKWHDYHRLAYAVTPRFAITSTPEQLVLAGRLLQEYPGIYLQTHLSENLKEIQLTLELFPNNSDYLSIYEQFGLVQSRSVFAHGIHLSDGEFNRLSAAQSTIAFCPTSNLFLGSGLFKLHTSQSLNPSIAVGLGTDIGAGTSFSILQTIGEAYKVTHLQGQAFSGLQGLFLATLGGARALQLDDKIGNFQIGKEADFVVLDLQATPLLSLRTRQALEEKTLEAIADSLFALTMLGDDRMVQATYIMGKPALFATDLGSG